MQAERWKQVESILQSALDRRPEEREAFLRVACAGDEALEQEVRSLLTLEQRAGSFLDRSPVEMAARDFDRSHGQTADESTDVPAGQVFSHYRVIEKMGGGGMGVVYKAEDPRLHRFVALKFLWDDIALDPEALNRFRREARAASALNHPNICTVYDIGEQDGRSFIVMEFLDGATLKDRINSGPLTMEMLQAVGIEIADALEAAHSAGIVHRDIKPANIFITRGNRVKILDFGLAKIAGPASHGAESSALTTTEAGMVMGTAAYMAPEQAQGEHVDHRADIWAFGLVLYEMAKGKRPMNAVRLRIEESPGLERIISKCLENDREQRYQHAAEIRADIESLKRGADSKRITTPPAPAAPNAIAKYWKAMTAAAAAVLAIVIAGYLYFHRPPKLTDKDTIVLADFSNTTGDPVFDGTLRQGLSVQLEQSPFLSLVSEQRIQKMLGLMGKPADTRLTPEVAREICERNASAAVLDGSINLLGSKYVLGLRARNCRTGDVLDDEQATAADKEDVLNALSQIAGKFRERVGESLATIREHNTPLEEATTASLDALKVYSAAQKVISTRGPPAALPLFKRAVELDPKFAIAHAYLGRVYGDIGETALSAQSTSRAYELRAHTADAEKFFINATYYQQVMGNLEKARETLELWEQSYPRSNRPPGILSGMIYPVFGQYEKTVEEAKKAMAIDPFEVFSYMNLATAYQFLNRLEEAQATFDRADERKMELPDRVQQFDLAFVKGDRALMERQVSLSRGKPGAEASISNHEAFALAYSGHLRQSRTMARRAADLAEEGGDRETAASFLTAAALWEAFFGNASEAQRGATAVLAISKARDLEYGAALALALSGDSSQARALADDLGKRFPEDTAVRLFYLPVLRAALALDHEPRKAIDLLQIAAPYELGVPLSWFSGTFGVLYPVYMRGEAYLKANQGAEAAAEFQKMLDHRAIVATDPIGAVARLQLGRAWAMAGDQAKAKAAYQDFLTLWKEADPDIPIWKQARAEFAKLN